MTYISQSNNNSKCNRSLPSRQRPNVCIIIIGRKEPTKVQQVMEAVSSQQLMGKYNMGHIITPGIDKSILRKTSNKMYPF